MQAATITRTRTITLPWGNGESTARADRGDEARVRHEIQDARSTASDTLSRSEKYRPGWTFDLDPSPSRVVRTSSQYEEQMIAVEADGPDSDSPASFLRVNGDSSSTRATFANGELVTLDGFLKTDEGTEQISIKVNDNGTLTYSVTETAPEGSDFFTEPYQATSVSSGPDDVYDEWDNGRSDTSGPDAIYNEWDNGRGYYFDGPDGRTSYDPYH